MRPSSKQRKVSQYSLANGRLWETKITSRFLDCSFSHFMTFRPFASSNAPVGSSQKRISAPPSVARNKATRCFSPPDKEGVSCFSFPAIPISSIPFLAIFLALDVEYPPISRGSVMLSKGDNPSNNWLF